MLSKFLCLIILTPSGFNMDYQTKRKYFGVTLPIDLYGRAYSEGSNKFYRAVAAIKAKKPVDLLDTIKICQRLTGESGELDSFPCYIAILYGIKLPSSATEKENLIRLACRFEAGEESLIQVSFGSDEAVCQEWLGFAKTWPKTMIVETVRQGPVRSRTVYTILFPGRSD